MGGRMISGEEARIRQAAMTLYMAGKWELNGVPADEQARLWENLRDALGLEEGYATNHGVHDQVEEESTSGGWSSDYYTLPPDAKELGDLIDHKDMNFNVGNMFKACYRLGSKDGTSVMYDLDKIKWFVEREINRQKKGQ